MASENCAKGAVQEDGSPVQPELLPEAKSELCSICCNPIQFVAVGRCNHALTCAICTLRLRMCYKDDACPFCKTQLKKVYVTEKPEGRPLRFRDLSEQKQRFAANEKLPVGIWVDRRSQCKDRSLTEHLLSYLRLSCALCDHPSGDDNTFESFKQLKDHLKKTHKGSTVCHVCYHANRYFPRELEIFETDVGFRKHLDGHPCCEFCGQRYFGQDELYTHMRKKHWLCRLCDAQGERHVYFEDASHYGQHLREAHHACREPDCVHSLIAFTTAEGLSEHMAEAHGIRPGGQGRRRNVLNVPPQALGLEVRPANARLDRRRRFANNDVQQQGSEGFYMIDDDLPPMYNAQPVRPSAPPPSRPFQIREEFPALPQSEPPPPRPVLNVPRKVAVRVQCPCGRIVRNVSVPENTTPEPIRCDAECERAQHRARLAKAFNIDTSTYSGSFAPSFSADLVMWARTYPGRVQQLEDQLHDRIRLQDVQRFQLNGLQRDMKKYAIELAETYGAVGRAVHNSNAVEVVLTNRCCLPARKLFQFATSLSNADYKNLVRESLQNTLILEDIEKSVNPKRYLISWDGDYEIDFLSKTTARLRFRTPQAFHDACTRLGGGIRDAFKVRNPSKDFKQEAESEIETADRNTSSPGSRLRSGSSSANRKSSTWRNVAVPQEELEITNAFEVLSRL